MKKFAVILATVLMCTIALCACTPSKDSLEKKFKDEGYVVIAMDAKTAEGYGVDSEKVDYMLVATKVVKNVYVIAFKNGSDATELYNSQKEKASDKFKVVKKGNAVIFGDAESVDLI